jgi:serine/threonine-protein kinase
VSVGSGSAFNIWTKPSGPGPTTRLTFGNRDRRPTWSPDGRLVAFVRDSANTSAVWARPADGSGPDHVVARIDRMVQEAAWSPDGRWLVVRTDNTLFGAGDLVGVPVRATGDSAAVPLTTGSFTELHPAVSPDGRWLAYTSNESGQNEVYVRPFPGAHGVRWQVSNGGGTSPVWSADGRELYYLDPDPRVVAAAIPAGSAFQVTSLTPLFDASGFIYDAFHQSFAVTPDGDFLFLRPRGLSDDGRRLRIVWVENWFADIEARLRR